jgi:malonate-semialdehyde dehydrogenase (acetylating)/methylmalonate-semialdehyde dehydrogenase
MIYLILIIFYCYINVGVFKYDPIQEKDLIMTLLGNYIDGARVSSNSNRTSACYNPATGEKRLDVSLSTADETRAAVEKAQEAFKTWSKVTPLNRARIMFKFKELIEKHADEIAELITAEHGKVFSDAKGELTRGLEVVEFACGIPHLQKGEHSLNVGRSVDSYSQMMPMGVCAGISPFNFPAMVPMWMFPVSIACGNTFVMKPSEKDPSVPMRLAELLTEAGLPDGVFNVVNGDKEAVDVLLTDERVQAVSFVGSTPIAEYIYSTASAHGKRVQALGGAKNHMIVMPDAEPSQVISSLMGAAYGSAGERCMAISVAVCVGDEVADHLIKDMEAEISGMSVGNGLISPEPHMGPLVSREHADKVLSYIDSGVEEGATLVVDGRNFVVTDHENGYFVGPTLFDNVKSGMRIYNEEIFGPVLAVVRVDSYEEALQLINDHEYGNGTAIFTRDGDTARNFTENVQVGMVGVNVPIPVPMAFHSFGGWKRSLFGPLHMHGPDGVRFYTRMKTITARWPTGLSAGPEFSMPTMK